MLFKSLRMLPVYFGLSLKKETEYKTNFYVNTVYQITYLLLWLTLWNVLLNQIGDFGAWSFPLVVLITGFVSISQGVAFMFIYIYRIPTEILSGQLNVYLVRPVHPFIHMASHRLNLMSLPRVVIGAALIVYVLIAYNIPVSFAQVILALATSIVGFFVLMIPFAMIGLLAFWIGKAEFLRDLFVELFVFQNYPLTEFPNFAVVVFTFVLPLIFSGTIPVLMLTQWSLSYSLAVFGIVLCILIGQISLFNIMWKKGLQRYESYGG